YATTEGIVHSVAPNCGLDIKPGDKVALDYRLASDYDVIDDQVRYNRVLEHNGEVVWRADNWMIMAVWRDGNWNALGDWCFLEELEEPTVKSDIIIITELSIKKVKNKGRVVS